MSAIEILIYPDARLKKKTIPVKEITTELHSLLDDMIETMYEARGVGLAAPQVGVNIRVIVLDVTPRKEDEARKHGEPELIELINPEIVSFEGKVLAEEGCLSVPGFSTVVKRYSQVKVKGLDRHGKEVELEAEDLLSRTLQHEINHLDGILFFDRLKGLKKQLYRKKIEKAFA